MPPQPPVVVGEVQSVSGRVVAIGSDGSERTLAAGDPVHAGDLIKTIGTSTIVVAMNDGSRFDLGRDAEALLDETVYGSDIPALAAAAVADIAEIQAAIAAGADPTEITEAPAAGGNQADDTSESLENAVGVERTGRVGSVEAGFETDGLQLATDPPPVATAGDIIDDGGAIDGGTDGTPPVIPVAPVVGITLFAITGDNLIDAAEAAASAVVISGSVSGDAADGDTVTLTVNGREYSGPVNGGGFSIPVSGADLAADSAVTASITVTNDAGLSASAGDTESYVVDDTASATITVDNITADDILNAAEAAGSVAVTGTVGGDAAPGDTVTMTINGTDYTTTVNPDGTTWSVDVAGSDLAVDTEFDATVEGTDDANNPFSATTTSTHTLDLPPSGNPPVATDDTGNGTEYTVAVGRFGGPSGWSNTDSLGETVGIQAKNADGSDGVLFSQGNARGVAGTPRTDTSQVPVQIEYDRTTDSTESIILTFEGNLTEGTLSVDRLFAREDGGEQGRWVALFNGQEVASGTFVTAFGQKGNFAIDTGGLVFNAVRFEAIDTVNGTGDGGDYWLTGFQGSGPATVNGGYAVAADEVLTIDVVSGDRLLDNDTDPDGDTLTVTAIDGVAVADGQTVTLASGALLTISQDGSFSYDPNGQFDSLAAGALDTDSFTYTISDGHGNTDTATVTVTNIGVGADTGFSPTSLPLIDDALPTIDAGVGDNTLSGDTGAEAFYWGNGYGGTFADPAVDTVSNFNMTEGDVLNLADLLVGDKSDLTEYLHFEQDGQDAVIHISSDGSFDAGYTPNAEDQTIVLQNVDINALGGNDQQIIDALLAANNLITE